VAVSQRNRCRYCIDAHTIMLHAVQQHDLVNLILSERTAEIKDTHLREVVEWGLTGFRQGAADNPYFSRDHLPELMATLLGFHYINRMVHIFLPETPLLLNQGQMVQRRMVGWLLGRKLPKTMIPGASLPFLPPADSGPGLATVPGAEGTLAEAFARWAAVIAGAGRAALADGTRDFVRGYLREWDGEAPPLGEGWLAAAVQGLPAHEAIEARLVLKAALTPHQMDATTVTAYQTLHEGDALLLGATAWGAFVTAEVVVSRAE
jgi:hypothetical protein